MSIDALNHGEWVDRVSKRSAVLVTKGEFNLSGRDHPQDESLQTFRDLIGLGYTTVTWHAENSRHEPCTSLNGQVWDINAFISGLSHDAPMFEKSHPGDRTCYVIVTGPEGSGLDPVQVGPFPYR